MMAMVIVATTLNMMPPTKARDNDRSRDARLQGWDAVCSCAVGARRIARARAASRMQGCTAKLFSFWARRSRDRRVPRINRRIAALHR